VTSIQYYVKCKDIVSWYTTVPPHRHTPRPTARVDLGELAAWEVSRQNSSSVVKQCRLFASRDATFESCYSLDCAAPSCCSTDSTPFNTVSFFLLVYFPLQLLQYAEMQDHRMLRELESLDQKKQRNCPKEFLHDDSPGDAGGTATWILFPSFNRPLVLLRLWVPWLGAGEHSRDSFHLLTCIWSFAVPCAVKHWKEHPDSEQDIMSAVTVQVIARFWSFPVPCAVKH